MGGLGEQAISTTCYQKSRSAAPPTLTSLGLTFWGNSRCVSGCFTYLKHVSSQFIVTCGEFCALTKPKALWIRTGHRPDPFVGTDFYDGHYNNHFTQNPLLMSACEVFPFHDTDRSGSCWRTGKFFGDIIRPSIWTSVRSCISGSLEPNSDGPRHCRRG